MWLLFYLIESKSIYNVSEKKNSKTVRKLRDVWKIYDAFKSSHANLLLPLTEKQVQYLSDQDAFFSE